jgi:hypothetical protein
MQATQLIGQLDRNRILFSTLLDLHHEVPPDWKPEDHKWCLKEIVCHLVDEEREDFRCRVDQALHRSSDELAPIDPKDWVISRSYIEQDYEHKCREFLAERTKSIHWLRSLNDPDWDSLLIHPVIGRLSAFFLLTNWLAHDYLHIRQIIRLKFDYLAQSTTMPLHYAGDWP